MSKPEPKKNEGQDPNLADQVDYLADQVKMLALNLAINLAKAKNDVQELAFMENEFTRLINGSVEVIREVNGILRVFKNEDKMVFDPPSRSGKLDRIEKSLNDIQDLSKNILEVISGIKQNRRQVDKYE